jgi:drug/metabolite transporter (DMT)-like permease
MEDTAALVRERGVGRLALRGYLMIGTAALIFGSTGVWVNYTQMPSSMLLVLRMATGGAIVAALFCRHGGGGVLRRRPLALRLVALGLVDAAGMLTFFVAMRTMNVAVGMFLAYLAPVYVAVAAPRLLRQPTERVVYAALALALGGIAVMLAPSLTGASVHLSVTGVVCGVASGLLLGVFFLLAKGLRQHVGGGILLACDAAIVAVAVLPLALWRTLGSGYTFSGRDALAVLALGALNTALAGTLFLHGMRFVKVQHSSIVGLLEPVSAPLYALLFLAQRPTAWTLTGGALILAAGVLVVLFGKAEVEPMA